MYLFIISLIIGLFSTSLTIFSIFFNYDEEKPVKLSIWGWVAVFVTIILAISGSGVKYIEYKSSLKGKTIADSLQNVLFKKNDTLVYIINKFEGKTINALDTNFTALKTVSSDLEQSSKSTMQIVSDVRSQIRKAYYPLEPITISYEIHISMDIPELQEYTTRVQKDIVAQLKKNREGRKITKDDLSDENVWFFLTNKDEWKPKLPNESKAYNILLTDMTSFIFQPPDNLNQEIRFTSVRDEELKNVFVHLPSKGIAEQKFELIADFTERIFIKKVVCINPMRTGKDETSISSIDLIGRKMTWKLDINGKLREFCLGFNYQSNQSQDNRKAEINSSENFKVITAKMVGLEKILK